jgi:hypothetical protein
MAGKSKKGGMRAMTKREAVKRTERKRALAQAIALANEHGIETSFGMTPPNTVRLMEQVATRTHDLMVWVQSKVNEIKEGDFWVYGFDSDGNRIAEPNKWFQLETALREELFEMASRMTGHDIDVRRVRIEELQIQNLSQALKLATQDIGLSQEQTMKLGSALRTRISQIEGTYEPPVDDTPPDHRPPPEEIAQRAQAA